MKIQTFEAPQTKAKGIALLTLQTGPVEEIPPAKLPDREASPVTAATNGAASPASPDREASPEAKKALILKAMKKAMKKAADAYHSTAKESLRGKFDFGQAFLRAKKTLPHGGWGVWSDKQGIRKDARSRCAKLYRWSDGDFARVAKYGSQQAALDGLRPNLTKSQFKTLRNLTDKLLGKMEKRSEQGPGKEVAEHFLQYVDTLIAEKKGSDSP